MTWFYNKLDPATAQRLRAKATSELPTTFASHYTAHISLEAMLKPDIMAAYSRRATGEKFLVCPAQAG